MEPHKIFPGEQGRKSDEKGRHGLREMGTICGPNLINIPNDTIQKFFQKSVTEKYEQYWPIGAKREPDIIDSSFCFWREGYFRNCLVTWARLAFRRFRVLTSMTIPQNKTKQCSKKGLKKGKKRKPKLMPKGSTIPKHTEKWREWHNATNIETRSFNQEVPAMPGAAFGAMGTLIIQEGGIPQNKQTNFVEVMCPKVMCWEVKCW